MSRFAHVPRQHYRHGSDFGAGARAFGGPSYEEKLEQWHETGIPPWSLTAIAFVDPHSFKRRGWRFWICDHCYAPRSLHPRLDWSRARPLGDNLYLSKDSPHFEEGW